MKPFGCPVTILNTIDHLGKFDRKADEGFFIGYSQNSKAFRVFNSRTRIVEENLHIRFSENTPNSVGSGPDWLFDIDTLTKTMNYKPIVAQSNEFSGTKATNGASEARKEKEPAKDYILLPLWTPDPLFPQDSRRENECKDQEKENSVNNTNSVNAVSSAVNTAGINELPDDLNMPELEDISIFEDSNEDVGAEADLNNLESTFQVSLVPTTRVHKDHPLGQVIGDVQSVVQTRRMSKNLEEQGFICTLKQRKHHKDLQNCLFACFLSQEEPKKVIQALKDPSWIEAMQEELLQFKLQEVWTLVDLPNGKRAIGSKWVFRNKLDEREIVIRNKARLMDVKSAFLYEKIKEEVYVYQPPGFEDLDFPDKVYKVEKELYELHQAPRAWYETLSTYLLDNGFHRGNIDKTLFIRWQKDEFYGSNALLLRITSKSQKKDGIFIRRGDSLVRATTTASSLEAKQGSGNIAKTQTKATPNEPSSPGTSSGGGPKCQETTGDTPAHTRYKRVSKMSNDLLLTRGNTLRSDEDSMKLQELMDICTTLTQRVLDLETELKETKTTHKAKVADLRKRVKKLEKKNSLDKEDASKQGRIADIDDNEEITLVSTTHDDVDEHVDDTVVDNIVEDVIEEEVVEDIITAKLIVDVSTAGDQEVSVVNVPVSAVAPIITTAQPTKATKTVEITTAPKVRGISIQEQEESTTKTASSQQPQVQDKRKGKTIMIEEPEMPKKRKVQERLDKEYIESYKLRLMKRIGLKGKKLNIK
ncbi:putative ribonuclease H-like domain-containing protein [Tanacetum coccineum]